MRMGNPAVIRTARNAQGGEALGGERRATYKGVYLKTAVYVVLTIAAALLTEFFINRAVKNGQIAEALTAIGIASAVTFIPLLVLSLIISFVPSTAKYLGCVYALVQGALLGCLSALVDQVYPGVALAAFLGTAVVLLVSLLFHIFLKPRISGKFLMGLAIAAASFAVLQLIMFLMSLTGLFSYTAYVWVQLGVSALCVVWATTMLFYDFASIDSLVQTGADKKYEWNAAFALTTTIIYLYVEILELVLRVAMLLGRNKD